MNSLFHCPKCNSHTNISLDIDVINTSCRCGYYSTMNLPEIISNLKAPSKPQNSNELFKEIVDDVQKGNDHLATYFKTLKDDHINKLMSRTKEIESSYEESFTRNKNMLTFLEVLIDNYDGSNEMRCNILNNTVIIYECKEKRNIDEVIKYYKGYNILDNIIKIEQAKIITNHYQPVRSLLRLKDGRFASFGKDKTVRVFNPSNNYNCEQLIERHIDKENLFVSDRIHSICQLDDGTIVASTHDYAIMIGDYSIEKAHKGHISKVLTLPNNRIASCSDDGTIKIWNSVPPYSATPITVLEGHSSSVNSILYIKEKDVLISGSSDETLRVWSMSTYKCETVLKGVECCDANAMYQIDSDRVIVGGDLEVSIVNMDKCEIEKKIKRDIPIGIHCFVKLRDNKTIVWGCDGGIFCFYDMNTGKWKIKEKNHENTINDLLMIDDNTFISCSSDNTIRVWKY